MKSFDNTEEIKSSFCENGLILVGSVLSNEEDSMFWIYMRTEGKSRSILLVKIMDWYCAGDDVGDMMSRSEKIVTTFEQFLGDELYQYHPKLMMKKGRTGGQYMWYDYGYLKENGCLYPDMASVFIVLGSCIKEN